MKRAVIIHCWGGYPQYCWYPHVKKELEDLGFAVALPAMPHTDNPLLTEWLPTLQEIIGTHQEEVYLIGHSLGGPTIMRYLETLGPNEKVAGVVFVAGFTDDLKTKELENFFTTPLDFAKIKSKANKFIAITSDNDPYVDLKYAEILKKELGAEIILKPGMKHFSGDIGKPNSCTTLPDVIAAVKKIQEYNS